MLTVFIETPLWFVERVLLIKISYFIPELSIMNHSDERYEVGNSPVLRLVQAEYY